MVEIEGHVILTPATVLWVVTVVCPIVQTR